MASESPAAVLVDGVNGVELAVVDSASIPVNTRAVIFAGKDSLGNSHFVAVDATGKILATFTQAQPANAAVASVPQSTTNGTTLLAANTARLGAAIYNNISSGFLFVKLGPAASPTDYTAKVAPGHLFELPFPAYTGLITGVWSVAGSGTAQTTEMS